jgi:hypothetical protein
MLTAISHMLKTGTFYEEDVGAEHVQRRPRTAQITRRVQNLSSFGYDVRVKPLADGAVSF